MTADSRPRFDARPACLTSWQGGTEGDEPLEPLDLPAVVVAPHLVAFDRPAPAPPAADLAAVAGIGGHLAAQPVPHGLRDLAADVGVPAGRRDQLDGQAGVHSPIIP